MNLIKIIKADKGNGYGVISIKGNFAKIYYFDESGNPTKIISDFVKIAFNNYCKINRLIKC